jgi:hypothetical protein
MGELQIADVRAAVALPFSVDFDKDRNFAPTPPRARELAGVFDQVVAWAGAMRELRRRKQEQQKAG